jgi:hypothetical protein
MNQFELSKAVDQILWNDWDPKGAKQAEGAYDTYYPYITPIVDLLNNQGSIEQLSELLHHITYDDFIMNSEPEDHLEVAEMLVCLVKRL